MHSHWTFVYNIFKNMWEYSLYYWNILTYWILHTYLLDITLMDYTYTTCSLLGLYNGDIL